MNNYLIRRAIDNDDCNKLHNLFNEVFYPEEVGSLAESIFRHFPGMENKYWFIAEDKANSNIVSAFTLIPWTWEIEGIRLKTAEMGIVGTLKEHRCKGLMKVLNKEFDKTFEEEQFDISVIQGIPGFYHKFGFNYALALENHINIPLSNIPERNVLNDYTFRMADISDIPFLIKEDLSYRLANSVSSVRNELHWKYILTEGINSEYASEIWIVTNKRTGNSFYFRILLKGFGPGLNIIETSEYIDYETFMNVLAFCKVKAIERKKAYVRLILHNESHISMMAFSIGAKPGKQYAWQIKIPDKVRFLTKLIPILEKRIRNSVFKNYSDVFRINFYNESIDINWENGKIRSVLPGNEAPAAYTFCIGSDLFPALALGHTGWEELQRYRPDTSPLQLYDCADENDLSETIGMMVNVLFPVRKSWIYCQY